MSEDLLKIEIDGKPLEARKGQMIIQVADEAGIYIPRFCYHKKLSIAANCRMCLVEVEKASKPLPACATPVMAGMKIFTESKLALEAQQGVMEFLLINHPLDCPICDQGGECELQDIAMGYGGSVSRYSENKRVVKDKNIGPLIATEMTRCIHCTRCVRFGEEIAGLRELGATGRGEFTQIGTYIEQSVASEMSGNMIDLCPVGALTAKPSRFNSRAWELVQRPAIAPHDCVGSNLNMHILRGEIKRVAPRENEAINEVWLSDRDRFSYAGLYSHDRLTKPMIKVSGQWQETDWEAALQFACAGLKKQLAAGGAEKLGALVAAHSTLEELYLLQKLIRGLGSQNIDHRLRQTDFSDQDYAPVMPWLGMNITELEQQKAVLLIGSNIRKDQPILANRLRKTAMQGAKVFFVNSRAYDWHFPVAGEIAGSPASMVITLAAIAKALLEKQGNPAPLQIAALLADTVVTESQRNIAEQLSQAEQGAVILGSQTALHPHFSELRLLAAVIAETAGCTFGYLPEAGNTVGAWLAGCVPHRLAAGRKNPSPGLNAFEMLAQPRTAYVLLNVEPEFDSANPMLMQKVLKNAAFVVSLTSYVTDAMRQHANVLLPISCFAETAGTFVNAEGRWQTMSPVSQFADSARPGWKVLRVMANVLGVAGFEYVSADDVRHELEAQCRDLPLDKLPRDNRFSAASAVLTVPKDITGLQRVAEVGVYAADAVVRRAPALQQTTDARACMGVTISAETAVKFKLQNTTRVKVTQDGHSQIMDLKIDPDIPDNCVWIPIGVSGNQHLGSAFGPVKLETL